MEILFVTSELMPDGGRGPAGRAASALPKALRGLDHHVTVVAPLYAPVDPDALQLARRLTRLELDLGGEATACELYDGRTAAGVDLLFIGHDALFGQADSMADGDAATVARRAGLFARAVAGLVETRDPRPELLHAHDWPGALGVARAQGSVPTVLTVYDVTGDGRFAADQASTLGIPDGARGPAGAVESGRVDALVAGLVCANRVTTGSPTYARQVLGGDEGAGLSAVFADLGGRFVGIAHGVDGAVWNPATDPHLVSRFDPMDLAGKRRNKAALQQAMGLPLRPDACLVGYLAADDGGSGGDLLAGAAEDALRNDLQLAVRIDPGNPGADELAALAERFEDRLAVRPRGGDDDAHLLIGGADVLVVPAQRAPAGHLEMCAQRYGTLPVVRHVGAFADSVVDCDADLHTGSGFTFDEATAADLGAALARAVSGFTKVDEFRALQRRVMRIDHSWERTARLYDRQYRLAAGIEDDA